MRKIALAVLVSTALAAPASAIDAGVVTAVDSAARTFTCHWKTTDSTYQTTEKTVFRIGRKAGSWSDLKVGETVQVSYHRQGQDRIADRVTIAAP